MRALIAVDGSAPSIDAARRASRLFGAAAEVTVLHVLEPLVASVTGRIGDPMTYQRIAETSEDTAERALDAAVDAVGGRADRRRVSGMDAGPVICEVAREVGADVIAVGSRGAGGIRRALTGSTSLHVVNNAPCPVLVVREGGPDAC